MRTYRVSARRAIRTELVKSSAEYLTTLLVAPWIPYPVNYQLADQATQKYRNTLVGLGILALFLT
jgi:hypothetical protein